MNFKDTLIGRPETRRTLSSLFTHWVEPHIPTTGIARSDFEQLIKLWQEQDLSPRTITMLIGLSTRYLAYLKLPSFETKSLSRMVARGKTLVPPTVLDKVQVSKLISTAETLDPDLVPVLLIGFHTGMRRGEIFGLQRDDIDLFKGRIHVQRSYNGPTKNGRSRFIPISEKLEKFLIKCYNWVEGNGKDKLIKPVDLNARLERLCKFIGIPKITAHTMRHTFATMALESGVSPKKVQELLGHSQLSTTLNIYWGSKQEKVDMRFLDDNG